MATFRRLRSLLRSFRGNREGFCADLVPEERRGTAYGLYNGVTSLALLPASLIADWLWGASNPATPFYFGAVVAFLAMFGIMMLVKEPYPPGLDRARLARL